MNSLIDVPLLHKLWGRVKKIININNINYLVLPIIYLFVILLVVPASSTIINNVTYEKMDSYTVAVITKEEKINYILERYNLSKEQFNTLKAIVLSEAEINSYEDAYAVINTIYNRTHSKNWIRSIENRFGSGKGTNLYYQVIAPNQFTVYASGSYRRYLEATDNVGIDAIIDFLYSENVMHNYLSFRSHSIKVNNSESFSTNGNNYFNEITIENRV